MLKRSHIRWTVLPLHSKFPSLLFKSPTTHLVFLWTGKMEHKEAYRWWEISYMVRLSSHFWNIKCIYCLFLCDTYSNYILPFLVSERHCERKPVLQLLLSKHVHSMWHLIWRRKTHGDCSFLAWRTTTAHCRGEVGELCDCHIKKNKRQREKWIYEYEWTSLKWIEAQLCFQLN